MTKLCLPKADVKWILAGCVVPDAPWIIQRALPDTTGISLIELRLYAIAQSTLLMSLVLCAFLALFSRATRGAFVVLTLGTSLHLGLDAMQTKWANGVVLLAPLRWELLNFGLFWPEDGPTYALLGLSAVVGLWIWVKEPRYGKDLQLPNGWRAVMATLLFAVYIVLPAGLKEGARSADLHYAATLADIENRKGKSIEFDRSRLIIHADGAHLTVWAGETFDLIAPPAMQGEVASIRGQFEAPATIRVAEFRIHPSGVRNLASSVGLLMIVIWWGLCLMDRFRV